MILSCPNYLHADVNDGKDLSLHQPEVTGGQLVTMSLLPGTVDSDVATECHLSCPSPLHTEGVLRGQQLRALRLETELEKRKKKTGVSMPLSVPLGKSFFLSLVLKTQPNHWTKRTVNTRLTTCDPRDCTGPDSG